MCRYALTIATVAFGCLISLSSQQATAQTKVDKEVERAFKTGNTVRVIIRTRPDPDQTGGGSAVTSTASYLSGKLGASVTNVKAIGKLSAVSAEITKEALGRLRDDPNVALVARDIAFPPTLFDSVPLIGANHYHNTGIRGTGMNVAVLDTGVDKDHTALAKSVVAEACFSTAKSNVHKVKSLCPGGFDVSLLPGASGQCPKNVAGCEHGTHVAGIVAGHDMVDGGKKFTGVAPSAGIVAVQVFTLFENDEEQCGAESPTCVLSFTSDQLRALEWVYRKRTELKIAAINMSLGGGEHDTHCDLLSPLTEIVERLKSKQVATVIAAGNEGFYGSLAEPACISHAISVAATTSKGDLDVNYSNVAPFVSLAAPGTQITSTVFANKYVALDGTSMAAPHVAASLALLRQKNPQWTVKQMMDRMLQVSVPVTDPRTGTVVQRIDLTQLAKPALVATAPPAGTGASVSRAAAARNAPPGAVRMVQQNANETYILRTTKPAAELQSVLSERCPNSNCQVRQIGNDSYRLEVTPRTRGSAPPSREEIERIFGGSVKVYDNRLTRPNK